MSVSGWVYIHTCTANPPPTPPLCLMPGDLDAVYMGQRSLAQHFDQTGDTWLSDHFHNRCLQTSLMIKSDNRKKEGEAHCNVGLSLENRGSFTVVFMLLC